MAEGLNSYINNGDYLFRIDFTGVETIWFSFIWAPLYSTFLIQQQCAHLTILRPSTKLVLWGRLLLLAFWLVLYLLFLTGKGCHWVVWPVRPPEWAWYGPLAVSPVLIYSGSGRPVRPTTCTPCTVITEWAVGEHRGLHLLLRHSSGENGCTILVHIVTETAPL